MAFQKVEYTFPEGEDDKEIEVEPASEQKVEKPSNAKKESDNELEIEIVDDVPKADRNRKPSEPPTEVTDEELEDYSDKVRNRIKHFSKGYHDERRAKEAALREREEFERYAKQLVEENKELKGTVDKNQEALLEQAKKTAAGEMLIAKRQYKQAYEAGDADKVVEAQEKLTAANIKVDRLKNFEPSALQTSEETPKAPTSQPVDERAAEWAKENSWFGSDKEMTGYAMGLHEKLVSDNIDPNSDEYYETINSRMRKLFPEQFDEEIIEEEQETKRQPNVVAPATRSTAPKKVRLSSTQVAIAKKLGVPLELYAQKVAEEMRIA